MKLHQYFIISTLVLMASIVGDAFAKPFGVTHFDNTSGLSSSNVKDICQDEYGLIWIGTKNGLNRFDGVSMQTYVVVDKKAGRGNNNVSALYNDHSGILWVGTDRGIFRFDPKTETFTVMDGKSKNNVSPDDWVDNIAADNDGNIWTLIPNQGVFRFDPDLNTDFYSITNHGGDKDRIPSVLMVTEKGKVFVGTQRDGVFLYEKESNKFIKIGNGKPGFDCLNEMTVASLVDDGRGSVFIIMHDGTAYTYSINDGTLMPLALPLPANLFVRASAMVDNELWIGTADGLYVIDLTTKAMEYIDDTRPGSSRLPDNIIMSITPDKDNNMWIGTMYGGMAHLRRQGLVFENFTRHTLPSGFGSPRLRGMAKDKEGRIWIGSEENGINIFDPDSRSISHPVCSSDRQRVCVFIERYGDNMVAGFHRGGADVFSNGRAVSNFGANLLNPSTIYTMLEDSKGNLWVSADYGIFKKISGSDEFIPVKGMEMTWANKIIEDSKGVIWFASIGEGVWRYDYKTNKLKNYPFYEDFRNGLRSNSVNSVMEDSSGNIWVSTERGGLAQYNPAQDNFVSFGVKDGLPDEMVYEILEDDRGFLWFGTAKGLVKFNPETKGIKIFNERNGLEVNQFNYSTATKGDDGKFYMGGIDGFVVFNPNLDTSCESLPPVYITHFRIDNEEMKVKSSMYSYPVNVLYAKDIEIPNGISGFSLGIATPSYDTHNTMVYSYRLLPNDKKWNRVTDPSNLTFVGLTPGKYQLEIKAQSDDVESVKTITLNILPPWYQTIWAYIGIVVLIIAGLLILFYFLKRYQQNKIKEKEKLFTINKERELYKSKMMFFTEIAHEIRTPLTLIGTPLEAIEEIGVNDTKVNKYIGVIRQNTNRLLDLTTQLLDFQKLDTERPELKYETVDIVDLVKRIVARFEPTITLKNKSLTVNLPQKQIQAVIDKEAITKIISNLLNNALKYSDSKIDVTLSEDGKVFRFDVASDGNKISGDDVYRIFEPFYQVDKNSYNQGVGMGLPLTRILASMHGGSIELVDLDGDGNTFELTIPLKQEGVEVDKVDTNPTLSEYVLEDEPLLTTTQAGYTLLFVDDNDEMRDFLYDQLSKSFVVETAASGAEALTKLKDHKFDIIVTDIMMPEMDGYEFCKKVKEDSELNHIPVVFLTAKNDLESKVKALKTGGEAYIEKPFSIKYFQQQVISILNNRRHEREAFLNKPFFSIDNMKLNKGEEEFMTKVIEMINKNIDDENFGVEAMADSLNMSRSSLLRKIKTLYNLSPVELIRLVRLKKAAELIQEGKYRISDVCFMVGINSSSYFSKLFFKQFGITPKAFEKQCQEKIRQNEKPEPLDISLPN